MNSKKSFFVNLGMAAFVVMVFMGIVLMGQAVVAGEASWIATAEATEVSEEEAPSKSSSSVKPIAAAIAVGLTALATGIAQSKIGAAGMGAMAEKPEVATMCIVMLAIPETIVILGFVVAAMIVMF